MGWCGGTEIFDTVIQSLNRSVIQEVDRDNIINDVIDILESCDWDTQCESLYWNKPFILSIFKKRNPEWFDEED